MHESPLHLSCLQVQASHCAWEFILSAIFHTALPRKSLKSDVALSYVVLSYICLATL